MNESVDSCRGFMDSYKVELCKKLMLWMRIQLYKGVYPLGWEGRKEGEDQGQEEHGINTNLVDIPLERHKVCV